MSVRAVNPSTRGIRPGNASASHLPDLVVDRVYKGGRAGTSADDPISKLLGVGNMGGFRLRGPATLPKLVALVTSGSDPDWPDSLDPETGTFTYFGDNRTPGKDLHASKGNVALRNMFDAAELRSTRLSVPPTFVFRKEGPSRDYRFLGLAVPGSATNDWYNQLVALWRTSTGGRFQNYRAQFTILDEASIPRTWIDSLFSSTTVRGPEGWEAWRRGGIPRALVAPRTAEFRTAADQLPATELGRTLVAKIHTYFSAKPHAFEIFAGDVTRWHLGTVASIEVTRPSRDGGRDAVGQLAIGHGPSGIKIDFAMEAKCYGPSNSVGVRELSRLISRLRHRQFGVLVTTSYLNLQAYQELKEDQHPIVVISAREVAEILIGVGKNDPATFDEWLASSYPLDA
jgi:hypothetical protein